MFLLKTNFNLYVSTALSYNGTSLLQLTTPIVRLIISIIEAVCVSSKLLDNLMADLLADENNLKYIVGE